MNLNEKLIPHPLVVRARLAQTLQEERLLRSLLRISVQAAQTGSRLYDERPEPPTNRVSPSPDGLSAGIANGSPTDG